MRTARTRKRKASHRRKGVLMRAVRLDSKTRGDRPAQQPLKMSPEEHLQGLWVTLGLADATD